MIDLAQRWREDLDALLADASGLADANRAIDQWAAGLATDGALGSLLYERAFQSYLGGQLFVRAIELADEAGKPGTVTLSAQRAAGDAFLGMPFEDAVAFFRSKGLMTPAEFDALQDRWRRGGFVARLLASERLQEVARSTIGRLLEQEVSLADARRLLLEDDSAEAASLGLSPESPSYIDNVIRTNVATAYGAGRWEAMTSPAVARLRPWVQYRTAGDSRVRPGHAALHGLVFANGSELAARYAPPLFYQCRCVMVTLSDRQFADRGLVEQTVRVAGIEAEEFWQQAPSALTSEDA